MRLSRGTYILLTDKMVDDTTVTCFMGLKKKRGEVFKGEKKKKKKKKNERGAEIIFIDGGIGCDPKLSVKITGRTLCSQPNETWRLRNFEFRVTDYTGKRSINVNPKDH